MSSRLRLWHGHVHAHDVHVHVPTWYTRLVVEARDIDVHVACVDAAVVHAVELGEPGALALLHGALGVGLGRRTGAVS